MPVSTCPPANALERLFQEGVPEAEATALEHHVLVCRACALKLKGMLPAQDALEAALTGKKTLETGPVDPAVAELTQRIKSLRPAAHAAHQGTAMLTFACPSCQKKLSVKEELAGKRVKCPGCGQVIAAPAAAAPAVTGSRGMTEIATPPPAPGAAPAAEKPRISPGSATDSGDEPTYPPRSTPGGGDAPEGSAAGHDPSLTDFLTPPQAPDELGRLGKYRVLKVLGHGGMGVVFRAEDPKLKRAVAIKAMLPALAASASAGQRFLREAEAMAAVEHDHVVRIYQVDEDRGVPFLAMEFLKGEPLDSRLQREQKLPVPEVLRIGREVAEALAAAHATGLIHRDIKPGNIWLEAPRARVKILDFGLARAAQQEAGLTQQGAIVGTPAYMAPEQGRGDKIDARCDLFSLGVVLYRIATGQQPFHGTDTISTLMSVAMHDPPPPAEVNAEVPAALSDLIMKMLEKEPAQRVGSAQEVVESLSQMERAWARAQEASDRTEAVPFLATRPPAAPATKNRSRRGLMLAAGLAAVIALLAAGTVFFWQSPNGLVRIEIDDDEIEATLTKTGVTLKKADDGKEITLAAGTDHRIKVTRGKDFSFETSEFVLKKGDRITLSVKVMGDKVVAFADGKEIGKKEIPGTAPPPPVPAARYALEFDGESAYVEIPTLTYTPPQPMTMEAWVTAPRADLHGYALTMHGKTAFSIHDFGGLWTANWMRGGEHEVVRGSKVAPGVRVHLALVWDGSSQQFFVAGKKVGRSSRGPYSTVSAQGTLLGARRMLNALAPDLYFTGSIDGVRISNVARYKEDFAPPDRLPSDADTLAVYHFGEGAGDVLKDSSGHGHDGRIVGAKWVKVVDEAPIPPKPQPEIASPFDKLRREDIPPELLKLAGGGDPTKAPAQLVAALGSADPLSDENFTDFDISPDGHLLALDAGAGHNLRLVELLSLKEVHPLPSGPPRYRPRFSPDGTLLAAQQHYQTGKIEVGVWRVDNGEQLATFKLPRTTQGSPMHFAFSPDGKVLALGTRNDPLKVYRLQPPFAEVPLENPELCMMDLVFLNKQTVLTRTQGADKDRVFKQWDVTTGKRLADLPAQYVGHSPQLVHPGDRLVLSEAFQPKFILYDLARKTAKRFPDVDVGKVATVVVVPHPDGRWFACRDVEGEITIRKTTDGQVLKRIKLPLLSWHPAFPVPFAVSPDGRHLVTLNPLSRADEKNKGRGPLFVLRLEDGARAAAPPAPARAGTSPFDRLRREDIAPDKLKAAGQGDPAKAPPEVVAILGESQSKLEENPVRMALHPDGKTLALSSWKTDSITFWDFETGQARPFAEKVGKPLSLRFSNDGKLLAVHSTAGQTRLWLWEVATGKPYQSILKTSTYSANFAFSPNDGTVYFTDNGVPKAVNVQGRVPPGTPEPPALETTLAKVGPMRLSRDGLLLVAAGPDQQDNWSVRSCDAVTGKFLRTLSEKHASVTSLALSPDGKQVYRAHVHNSNGVFVHETATGKPLGEFRGARGMTDIALSPDGKLAASSDPDGAVYLWDTTFFRQQRVLRLSPPLSGPDKGGGVREVLFTPDGRHLLTRNADGTVYVVRLSPPPASR